MFNDLQRSKTRRVQGIIGANMGISMASSGAKVSLIYCIPTLANLLAEAPLPSFNSDGFCQVTRLIDVATAQHRRVITQ